MTITFPAVDFQIIRQQALAASLEQNVLIVGQKTSAGAAVSGALQEDIQDSNSDIANLFGATSIVAEMVREFRKINKVTGLDVIALDDDAGATNAAGSIAFTGTATAATSIRVGVGSDNQYRFTVDANVGDTAATIAGRLEALIDAATTAPFTAALATATVNITATNGGTLANDWTIYVDGDIPGIAIALTGFSGGATNPVISSSLFDVIASKRYQTIVWPSVFSDSVIEAFVDARFNVANNALHGIAVVTDVDTAANTLARAAALQSQSMVVIASKAVSSASLVGSAHREFPDVISARFAAVRSRRLTDDAGLSDILSSVAALDQFGGRALASLPYANTLVPNMPVIRPGDQFTPLELDNFVAGGVSVIGANTNFSGMILGEVVTTNNTNASGDIENSFKFLNTVDTIVAIRDAFFFNMKLRYAQTRLTDGDLLSGRDMANKASIEAFTEEIYQDLAVDGLVQAGSLALTDFKTNGRQVVVDVAAGAVTVNVAPLLVNGLRSIRGTVQVNFGG